MSVDAEYLRVQAGRMLALALTAQNAELSQKLTMRASDYLDQAMALELEQPPPLRVLSHSQNRHRLAHRRPSLNDHGNLYLIGSLHLAHAFPHLICSHELL